MEVDQKVKKMAAINPEVKMVDAAILDFVDTPTAIP